MKFLLILLSIGAASTIFWFCKTSYQADNLPSKQLRWGTGGGITGAEAMTILLENGQMFNRADVNTALAATDSARARKAKKLFKLVEKLDLMNVDFKNPGNTYKFIEINEGDKVHRISWGDGKTTVPAGVEDLFEKLNGLGKKD
jgi:hypothetical protein